MKHWIFGFARSNAEPAFAGVTSEAATPCIQATPKPSAQPHRQTKTPAVAGVLFVPVVVPTQAAATVSATDL
jgi:hypothetical protein